MFRSVAIVYSASLRNEVYSSGLHLDGSGVYVDN